MIEKNKGKDNKKEQKKEIDIKTFIARLNKESEKNFYLDLMTNAPQGKSLSKEDIEEGEKRQKLLLEWKNKIENEFNKAADMLIDKEKNKIKEEIDGKALSEKIAQLCVAEYVYSSLDNALKKAINKNDSTNYRMVLGIIDHSKEFFESLEGDSINSIKIYARNLETRILSCNKFYGYRDTEVLEIINEDLSRISDIVYQKAEERIKKNRKTFFSKLYTTLLSKKDKTGNE